MNKAVKDTKQQSNKATCNVLNTDTKAHCKTYAIADMDIPQQNLQSNLQQTPQQRTQDIEYQSGAPAPVSSEQHGVKSRVRIQVPLLSLALVSFAIFIGWIIYQANTGGNNIFFDLVRVVPYGDKIGHMMLFGTLTSLALIASRAAYFNLFERKIYYAIVAISTLVFIEEVSQGFIATRTFDIGDLTADAVGITLFSVITIKWINRNR
ncbi:VanZ like family protein [Shewanella sp. P1-14-1]|uniref:VanZ family protein n=1 Tax=Shewanella sp. P1-14-1 TaxID=1723761 RepID=UPI0006E6920C|nr:VanZ family protein [Shewanella sp. P1-14-1]KPZ71592.1 VanZ like family protein [Shewanella sp. P1-14-1]